MPHTKPLFFRYLGSLFAIFLSVVSWQTRAETPTFILTSIKPLALILQEAYGDLITVDYLLPPQASPHHYSLKPSDLRKLSKADLFVWAGPGLENFLLTVLKNNPADFQIALIEEMEKSHPELLIHLNALTEHTDSDHSHEDQLVDPHIWLNRENAAAIAQLTGMRLEEAGADPGRISMAFNTFEQKLTNLTGTQTTNLNELQLITYHNAYAYLARDLNLTITDIVTPQTDVNPGAKHLVQLKQKAIDHPTCVIVEPQFSSKLVDKIFDQEGTKIIEIDPMAGQSATYTDFFSDTLRKLENCK
ncbi:hypothetical protein BTA51_07615 [Hahella sp. CCB-MM4]|uniref:metal ABC transporter substrate-binding protein n=1 Tax=Hahella sp. (strain CCB-MM4) TaxID=1926491 RepID=UPI000B9BDEB6|nr:metal ABC transporter substrate-binding protein [Hahella sp. CCB-MM4]OZG73674.1 hypothetical protein BTA51_07615 [Hahella sp. CCB-MM4]